MSPVSPPPPRQDIFLIDVYFDVLSTQRRYIYNTTELLKIGIDIILCRDRMPTWQCTNTTGPTIGDIHPSASPTDLRSPTTRHPSSTPHTHTCPRGDWNYSQPLLMVIKKDGGVSQFQVFIMTILRIKGEWMPITLPCVPISISHYFSFIGITGPIFILGVTCRYLNPYGSWPAC